MGSLFDGVSGFPYCFEKVGAKAVFSSEVDEFCIAVAKEHFPEEEREEDAEAVNTKN